MMEHDRLVSLVKRSQQGEDAALNELMNECYEGFYYFALKSTGDSEKALEATQDACVEILSTLKNLREPAAFITWSQRIIYHQCVRHHKQPIELQAEEDEDGLTIFDRVADEDATAMPEEVYEDKEFQQTVQGLLNSLPPEQCSALMLYYYDKLSVKEIAEIQGTTEGTVKSRLNYGRKSVKKKVEDYEERTGLRLHGAMPILLFRLFSQGLAQEVSIPTMPIISGGTFVTAGGGAAGATVGATVGGAATGIAAGGAAGATAEVVATAAGASYAVKLIVGLVAAVAVIGTTVGTVLLSDDSDETDRTEEVQKDPDGNDGNGGNGDNNGNGGNTGNGGDSDHAHVFRYVGKYDHNYHQLSCACGEVKQELHQFGDSCAVCEMYNPFEVGLNYDDDTCVIESYNGNHELVVIPSTIGSYKVTTVGEEAFDGCNKVQEIIVPENVQEIQAEAFGQCRALKKIHLPASLTTIGENTFILCDALEDVYYPGTVQEWEALNIDADDVMLPVEAVHCSDGDFSYLFDYQINEDGKSCTILSDNFCKDQTVIPAVLNGHLVTAVGDSSGPLCSFMGKNPIQEVIIEEGITTISAGAFYDYESLTKVVLPDSITEIGDHAFFNTAIAELTLPKGITSIGTEAFCKATFTEVTLPKSLVFIGEGAFSECGALETVVYEGTMEEWKALGVDLDSMLYNTPALHLQCSDGELIWGYGYEVNEDGETCTITEIRRSSTHLVLPDAIDGYRVTHIGNGEYGLYSHHGMGFNYGESFVIPEGVLAINDCAFWDYEHLTQIQLPSTLLRIGSGAFSGCENLTEITLPDGLTEIGANAFSCCGLTKVVLPDSVTSLGDQAFYECEGLTELVLSRPITQIGTATLQGCGSLEKLTVPGVLTYIGVNSMRDCHSLTTIEFGGTVAQWNAIEFDDYWNMNTESYTVYCTDGTVSAE